MTALEKEFPGPHSSWRPEVATDKSRVILQDFPETLYPEVHLDTIENSEERWGQRRKGYPHIEDEYLVSTPNLGASGNCYFMAIATLLFGSSRYWHTVKGHHLQYVNRVLRDKSNPRYKLYTKINLNLSTSGRVGEEKLNLWMRLCTPYAWQDGELLQVTADLYGVFLVQYTMESGDRSEVEGVRVRGNYNSTHWMIRFVDNNHFQPLLPADRSLSEFLFPPITRKNTEGKVSMPTSTPKGGTNLNHPWRSPMSRLNVPEQICPIQLFEELSSLNFTLITGFNTKSSTLDSTTLQMQYDRAAAESLHLPRYAEGMETAESKVIKRKSSGAGPKGERDIIQSKVADHIPPADGSKILKSGQNETKGPAASPSPRPANRLHRSTGKPVRLSGPESTVLKLPQTPEPKQVVQNTLPDNSNVTKDNPEPVNALPTSPSDQLSRPSRRSRIWRVGSKPLDAPRIRQSKQIVQSTLSDNSNVTKGNPEPAHTIPAFPGRFLTPHIPQSKEVVQNTLSDHSNITKSNPKLAMPVTPVNPILASLASRIFASGVYSTVLKARHTPQPKQVVQTALSDNSNVVKGSPGLVNPSMPKSSPHPVLKTTTKPTHYIDVDKGEKERKGKNKRGIPFSSQESHPLPTLSQNSVESPKKRIKFVAKSTYKKLREAKRRKFHP